MARLLIAPIALLLISAIPAIALVHNVTVGNNFFSPLGTIVQPGDTVHWTWVGGIPHNTESTAMSPKQWNSVITSMAGFTFEVIFSAADGPGPFPYLCVVHPFTMKDTIFVMQVVGCCEGSTGDIDFLAGPPDIGDLTFLIDNQFITFVPIPCPAEADFDLNGIVDIADLTIMIDHLFIDFPPLPACQ